MLAHWNNAANHGAKRITKVQAMDSPALVKPGMIFIMDSGGGAGHTGLVERVRGGRFDSIEGNTGTDGSREGIGVFRRTTRTLSGVKGFLNYSGV